MKVHFLLESKKYEPIAKKQLGYFFFRFFTLNQQIAYKIKNIIINQKGYKKLRYASISRLHSYCLINGRSRAVFQEYRISRVQFRSLASKGFISGLRKSSW